MVTSMSNSELVPEDPFVIPDDPKTMPKGLRARMALELRKAGASYQIVADKLGYASAESAENAIRRVIDRLYEGQDIEAARNLELERLDALQLIAWRQAKDGNLSAIDRILKIMERRAKYLGMDQQETQPQGSTTYNTAIVIGGSEQEYVEKLKEAREQAVKALPQG